MDPNLPQALRDIVLRATAKKAQERFADSLALRHAIEEAIGPLPENQELADHLLRFFPDNEETRSARRRVIETGMADLARRQWEKKDLQQAPSPKVTTSTTTPVTRTRASPSSRTMSFDDSRDRTSPGEKRRRFNYRLGLLVMALVLVAAFWSLSKGRTEKPVLPIAKPTPPIAVVKPPPPPLPPPPAPIETPDAATSLAAVPQPPIVPTAPPSAPRLRKGFVSVSAPEGAIIFIDGRKMGVAPLTNDLSIYEGKHNILVTVGTAKWQQAFSIRADERMYFNVETE